MTTTQRGSRTARTARVGDRVLVQRGGVAYRGWVSSIHRGKQGVEYVVRTEDRDGGMGQVLNIWATPEGRGPVVIAARARR
jgi:hypothetical protein